MGLSGGIAVLASGLFVVMAFQNRLYPDSFRRLCLSGAAALVLGLIILTATAALRRRFAGHRHGR